MTKLFKFFVCNLFILNHNFFFMVYYYLFGVIYFQVSFDLKVTLHLAKIAENTVTGLV